MTTTTAPNPATQSSSKITVPRDLDAFLTANRARIQRELFDFLRIPSVSARSEHRADTVRAAEWVATSLRDVGLRTEVIPTDGHPIVLGEWRGAGPDRPTILIYGHYDVQPPEPLELWTSPPFEPEIRDGKIFARGSVDDKGQVFLHIKALEAHFRVRNKLPVNVVVLIEGEEEVGSDHLGDFVRAHVDRLRCDAIVISDSAMFPPGIPSILSSLRGLVYLEVHVDSAPTDLHSGGYGGAVVNPATALARIIATFHDANGHIAIPGFYDSVDDWDANARARIAALPFNEAAFAKEVGVPAFGGELGYSMLERLWARPTCEVNGLLSGYTGEGAKTVLPAHAMAKISCRLVPKQDPQEIGRLLEQHIHRVAPREVRVTVRHLHGGRPWRADLSGPIYDAATRALNAAFNREPVIMGEGGSIPVVADFADALRAPVLLMGFGMADENAHAPNEWMGVDNFERGMRAVATLWDTL
jgi:acetylornithine deacetylase/succinyl-diaminopimelate desuccinylase-like protein